GINTEQRRNGDEQRRRNFFFSVLSLFLCSSVLKPFPLSPPLSLHTLPGSVKRQRSVRRQSDRYALPRLEAGIAADAGDEALAAVLERQQRLAAHRLDDQDARFVRAGRRRGGD